MSGGYGGGGGGGQECYKSASPMLFGLVSECN